MSIDSEEYVEIADSVRKDGEPNRDIRILNKFFGIEEFTFPPSGEEMQIKISHSRNYPEGGLNVELHASLISHLNENISAAPPENTFFRTLYDKWYAEGEADDHTPMYSLGVDDFWKWVADMNDRDWQKEIGKFIAEQFLAEGWLEKVAVLDCDSSPRFGSDGVGDSNGTFHTLGGSYSYDSYLDMSCQVLGMTIYRESYVIISKNEEFLVFNLQSDNINSVSASGCISASFPPITYMPLHLLPELSAAHALTNSIYEKELEGWALLPFMRTGDESGDSIFWDANSDGDLQHDECIDVGITSLPIIEVEDWEDWLEEHPLASDGVWVSGVELSIIEFYKAIEKSVNPPIIWDPNCGAYFLGGRQIHASNTGSLPAQPYWLSAPESYTPAPYLGQHHLGKQQLELFPDLQVGNRFINLCKGELMPCH
jgi:hypothetical protein